MSSSSLSSTSSYLSSSSSSFSEPSFNDDYDLSLISSSASSQNTFIQRCKIVNNLKTFIRSKERTLSLEDYPDAADDIFGVESTWSHVEVICSNVYLVSSVSNYQSQLSDALQEQTKIWNTKQTFAVVVN